jgi:hypothetical protein
VAAAGTVPSTANGTIYVPADTDVPFDVPANATVYFSVMAVGGSTGTAYINGPFSETPGV